MSFNTPVFLFFFLPICLVVYLLADRRYQNLILLAASLVFFAWGQWIYLPLMLALIGGNYFLARLIEQERPEPNRAKRWLVWGIAINLGLLFCSKLLTGYGTTLLPVFFPPGKAGWLLETPLPLGLSYITFQVVAYLLDVYHKTCDSEKNLLHFSLYVLLFPKIVTGPITRYRDLAGELTNRQVTSQGVASGIRRFILGLAKKALIADQLAQVINPAFSLSSPSFSPGMAWVVVVGYAIQLYFDFSGYTDMAIGLGQMFGFRFVENFNYPYLSRSIGEFWRRWHISLSSWFRDYVFYPLEFTRRRQDRRRQRLHIVLVFLLTGLWHGLTPGFVVWGLLHGLTMALESTGFGRWLKRIWAPLQHGYAVIVILLGWVFFRSPSLDFAVQLLARLAGSSRGVAPLVYSTSAPLPLIEPSFWLALGLGILFSFPVLPAIEKGWQQVSGRFPRLALPLLTGADLFLLFLLIGSVAALVSSSFVGNIYGNF